MGACWGVAGEQAEGRMGGESKDRRSSGKTGRSVRVIVRRQISGKALVWISERTDVGKSTGLDFSTLPLTCVILCTSTVPLGPLLTEQDSSPWRPPRF